MQNSYLWHSPPPWIPVQQMHLSTLSCLLQRSPAPSLWTKTNCFNLLILSGFSWQEASSNSVLRDLPMCERAPQVNLKHAFHTAPYPIHGLQQLSILPPRQVGKQISIYGNPSPAICPLHAFYGSLSRANKWLSGSQELTDVLQSNLRLQITTSRLDYSNVLYMRFPWKWLEISTEAEHYSQDIGWSGLKGLYHSSIGLSTLASSLFPGTIQDAGVDI